MSILSLVISGFADAVHINAYLSVPSPHCNMHHTHTHGFLSRDTQAVQCVDQSTSAGQLNTLDIRRCSRGNCKGKTLHPPPPPGCRIHSFPFCPGPSLSSGPAQQSVPSARSPYTHSLSVVIYALCTDKYTCKKTIMVTKVYVLGPASHQQ